VGASSQQDWEIWVKTVMDPADEKKVARKAAISSTDRQNLKALVDMISKVTRNLSYSIWKHQVKQN